MSAFASHRPEAAIPLLARIDQSASRPLQPFPPIGRFSKADAAPRAAFGCLGPNRVIQFGADELPECANSRHSRQVRLPPLYGGLELDEGSGRAVIPSDAGN
jgi:hypothetical protein